MNGYLRDVRMLEENKQLVRRFIEGLNHRHLEVFDTLLAPDFIDHTPGKGAEPTREGWKRAISNSDLSPFPDLQFHIEDQIAEDDRVVTRLSTQGTHMGEFLGIPATGRQTITINITIFRIAGGKITERWTVFDAGGLMRQLGATPSPKINGQPVSSGEST